MCFLSSIFKRNFLTLFVLIFIFGPCLSQPITQKIRGQVIDSDSRSPIPGVLVILNDSINTSGAVTDSLGIFEIRDVPVGRQTLKFYCLGYNELILPEVMVNSSREAYLSVRLTEVLKILDEVTVKSRRPKDMPINNMTLIGARSFSVEETSRYPVSVDDPSRMAMNFAGVTLTGSDINNEIIIRGNSPQMMSWQVEGVQVFNPNHFSDEISSGGAVSILNNNILDNSDFLLSAWPAEYGNAISGIFDIHLRDGNNQQGAYAFQAGILGLDLTAEGPFNKNYDGSFLVNYRYSTLSLYDKLNIENDNNHTKYQDGAFKIKLPDKKLGEFSIWGFGGTSGQVRSKKNSDYQWNIFNGSSGLEHDYFFDDHNSLHTSISYSGRWQEERKIAEIYPDSIGEQWKNDFKRNMIQISSQYQTKINEKHTFKTGFNLQRIFFEGLKTDFRKEDRSQVAIIDGKGHMDFVQLFIESKNNFGSHLTINPGLHFSFLFYNHTFSLEPRIAVKWFFKKNQSLGLGYGLHSQLQSLWIYQLNFGQILTDSLNPLNQYSNKNLGFTKAQHIVLSYDNLLTESLRLKLELYYQSLYNIPVIQQDFYNNYPLEDQKKALGNYSIYNNLEMSDSYWPLENKGTAHNYGIELTIEKFLDKGYYFLITGSLFEAKYKGINGIAHDSQYNGNYLFNAVAGKEFRIKKNQIFGFNLRYFISGGQRYTPVLWIPMPDGNGGYVKNPETGNYIYRVEYDWNHAYSVKFKDYLRTDIGLKYIINRKKVTHMIMFDIQNLFNRKNILFSNLTDFNYEARTYDFEYQYGRLPVFKYRIEF